MTWILAILVLVKAWIAKAFGAFPQTHLEGLQRILNPPAVLRPELLVPPLFRNPVSAPECLPQSIFQQQMFLKRWSRSLQSLNAIKHRGSRQEVFCKKRVLINFAKVTGKHLCQSLLFDKVAILRPATLLKKRLWHRCFPVNFLKFLWIPFFIERLWWLLLKAIATLLSIGTAPRNRLPCFSSLFLTPD